MWMLFPAAAFADAAGPSTSTCSPAELVATMPADGDTGVLPEAVIALVFTDGNCGGAFFDGMLSTELGGPQAFTFETEGTLLRIVPDEPFVLGDVVHLEGQTGSGPLALSFTVGAEGLVLSGEPSAVEVTATSHCDALAFTTLEGTIRFEDPASGLLQAAVVTDQLSAGWVTVGVVDGRSAVGFDAEVLGAGQDHCVDARLLDETGAVVWQVEGTCASSAACPAEERSPGIAGCSTAGGPGGAGALALALVLVGRRRRGWGRRG